MIASTGRQLSEIYLKAKHDPFRISDVPEPRLIRAFEIFWSIIIILTNEPSDCTICIECDQRKAAPSEKSSQRTGKSDEIVQMSAIGEVSERHDAGLPAG